MTQVPQTGRTGGVRGYELDVTLSLSTPMSRAMALEILAPWGSVPELYGQGDEIRSARLTGDLDTERLHSLLRAAHTDSFIRSAEVGRRGFLRSVTGSTEWMPWRRNVVLPWNALETVTLEDGLRYLLE